MLLRRLAALALASCLVPVGCGPGESRPKAASVPPAPPPATVAIESPVSEPESAEPVPPDPAATRPEPWEQLLARQAVFLAESGAVCDADRRATLVLPGAERPSNLELAARAGCSEPVDDAPVPQICCPSVLELPSSERTGNGAGCATAVTAYLGMVAQSGAVPPGMAGLTMTIQQQAVALGEFDYAAHCQIPAGMSLRICAATRSGRAEGVTVISDPPSLGKADCVAQAVRSLAFRPFPMPVLDLSRAEIKAASKLL